jgi:hypothetical protein
LSPFLDDRAEHPAGKRSDQEILDDLLRSSPSIDINLSEMQKRRE